jgi:hypothetical protein
LCATPVAIDNFSTLFHSPRTTKRGGSGIIQSQIPAPAAVLVVWTLVILLWLVVARLPALKKAGIGKTNRPSRSDAPVVA